MPRRPADTAAVGAVALALVVAAAAAIAPLFLHPTLPRGDDVAQHVQFAQGFSAALAEGVWFPRWLRDTNLGWGAPVFVFYPPLATAIVSLLHVAGLDLFTAFRVALLLMTVAAACAAAALAAHLQRRRWPVGSVPRGSGRLAAVLAGSLFVLLPYHAIDVFNRFALAETLTFAFLPLYFLGLEMNGRRGILLLAAAFAGLCAAHPPTAYLAGLIALAWTAALAPRRLPARLGGLLLGAALAAATLVPAVLERRHVHAEWLQDNPVYRFDSHYIVGARPVEIRGDPILGRLTDAIDLPTLPRVRGAVLLTLGLALLAWGVRCFAARRPDLAPQGTAPPLHRYAVLSLAATLAMTPLADPLWRHLPGLASVDFPWRLTTFVTLGASLLVGLTASDLIAARAAPAARVIAPALLLAWPLVWAQSLRLAAAADWTTFTPGHAEDPVVRLRVSGALMPKSNPAMRGFRFRTPPEAPARIVAHAAGEVEILRDQSHLRSFAVSADRGATLAVATFDYPGWTVQVDGRETAHRADPDSGAILVDVPPGRHEVTLRFGATPARRAAGVITAVALLVAVSLTVRGDDRTMPPGREP